MPTLWLALIVGALLVGAFFLWTSDTRRGSTHPEYSVARTDDQGAALVFRLFKEAGLSPQVWDRDLSGLKGRGTLVLIAPARPGNMLQGSRGDILPYEIEALDRWVKEGNVAVIFSRDTNDLYQALGLIVDEPKGISGTPAVPAQPAALARGVAKLQTQTQFGFKFGRQQGMIEKALDVEPAESPIDLIPAEQWVELFKKESSGRSVPQVVSAARGKGLYVAVNDIYPASNLGLPAADNARFMLNLARLNPRGGTLWFDEFHKRTVERNIIAYLRERALAPALIYGLLVLGLCFWRTSSRFGDPAPLVADRRRDSAEYVRAAAALYQNAGMARDALSIIYADFRKRLTGALRMDGLTDLQEVGRRYELRTGRPAIEARQVLIEAEAALARQKLDDAEALQFCARLTQLDQALQRPVGDKKGRHKQ